ncbi:hypothetical protein ACFV9D_06680 [Streptomyces sp. NPDC059875]|uniref:hypothetical protein n=1 Tax=unclassified Streptomyces TaxID=2593676 RepID=UPI00364EAAC8
MLKRAARVGWRRWVQAATVTATVGAAGLVGAVPATAQVVLVQCPSDDLQQAIDDADPGETLRVQGVCTGSFTIDKNLTLTGAAGAALEGNANATTLTVTAGVQVQLNTLSIVHPSLTPGRGIDNSGTLTLSRSTVSGNDAVFGGGILNNAGATLTLNRSTVSGNHGSFGAGIHNTGGTATLNRATVSGNTAESQGGGINNDSGTVALNRSTVTGNEANNFDTGDAGGGIYNRATVTRVRTVISDNNPDDCAGSSPVPDCT